MGEGRGTNFWFPAPLFRALSKFFVGNALPDLIPTRAGYPLQNPKNVTGTMKINFARTPQK